MPTETPNTKRTRKSKPTPKQRLVVEKVLENMGAEHPKPTGEILREAGYAPSVADNPQFVTESKGFKELMEQYLPDDKLVKVHAEGLEANKIISANITYGDANEKTNDFIEVPDHPTREKFLKLAYTVKGKITPEITPPGTGNTYNIFFLPKFQQSVKAFEQDIKSLITNEHVATTEAPLGAE
jgi:hypothetical protein